MARSIEQIYQEILLAKDAEPLLNQELTKNNATKNAASRTAIWQLWCYVFAVVAHSFERLWDVFKKDITDIIDQRRLGTPEWYVSVSKDFQFGAGLSLQVLSDGNVGFVDENDNNKVSTDDSKKIIKRAAFKESRGDGLLLLKVAKEDGDNQPEPLTEEEFKSFETYIDRIKFAGTYILLVSTKPDQLEYTADVFYDSTKDRIELSNEIKEAARSYIDKLPFDGIFVKNELLETMRAVDGIDDVVLTSLNFNHLEVSSDPNTPTDTFSQQVDFISKRIYESTAGHIKILPEDENTLRMISASEAFLQ